MLVIRFQRTGRRNIPTYRLIATEKSSSPKTGRVTEYLGQYLPARDPPVFDCKRERVEHWLKAGAQASDTAARLLTRAGVKGLEKFIKRYTKRKKKVESEALTGAKEGQSAVALAKADDKEKKAA